MPLPKTIADPDVLLTEIEASDVLCSPNASGVAH